MVNWENLDDDEKLACVSLFPEESKKDNYYKVRLKSYRTLGFTEEAKRDNHGEVRLEAYRTLGFTEEAKKDDSWTIRLAAYRALGFTKEALQDVDLWVREEAIMLLGYPIEALEDACADIRKEAEIYYKIKNKLEVEQKLLKSLCKDKSDDQSKIIKETYEKIKKYLGE